uniref:FYVE-type domain-containing protein n=1 Tax=Hyaloperonospora arabidopsidis (strain Emoy2) TaxID=559515 RepID=M4BSG7_HYAAE
MTKLPLEHPPFPPLQLVESDKGTVVDLADIVVTEAIEDYEMHFYNHHGLVDTTQWVRVKQVDDDLVVYQDRQALKERRLSRVNRSRPSAVLKSSEILNLLWFGTIRGDLDDVMCAVVNRTPEEAKVKAAFTKSTMLDFAVLETLVHPKACDPFRGMQVKWAVNAGPALMRSVVRCRDFVYLESTGMTTMSTGERVGFQLIHSVSIPAAPELHQYKFVRGNMTLFHLFRQQSDGVIETYVKAFVDLMGDMPLRVAMTLVTSGMVSVSKLAEYALVKKLNWQLGQRRVILPSNRSKFCHVCCKLLQGSIMRRRTCKICMNRCCARCCVSKKLFFTSPQIREVVQKTAMVCKECIQVAASRNGFDVARDELLKSNRQVQAYRYWSIVSPTSSTSSMKL